MTIETMTVQQVLADPRWPDIIRRKAESLEIERNSLREQVTALRAALADIEGTTLDPRAMKKAEDALKESKT